MTDSETPVISHYHISVNEPVGRGDILKSESVLKTKDPPIDVVSLPIIAISSIAR